MAQLMGFAFYLMLPSLVATAGIEAWGDDSALLQVEPAMASIQSESFKKSMVGLRSLLAVVQDAARKHNDSVADSDEFYMNVVQPQMENATNFIVNELATQSAKKSKRKSCKLCWATAIIDGLTLVYEKETSSGGLAAKCSPIVVIVWWVMGMITLTEGQGLPIPDALDMLAQQFTSVGYGSSTQDTVALKMFHGLHGVVSQMSVNRVISEIFTTALNAMEQGWAQLLGKSPDKDSAFWNLLTIGALTTFVFSIDLSRRRKLPNFNQLLDGIYQALITMTTIGYGDKSPTADWAKAISPLTLPAIVTAFSRWNDAVGPESAEKNQEVDEDTSRFINGEVCQCFGKNFCGGKTK